MGDESQAKDPVDLGRRPTRSLERMTIDLTAGESVRCSMPESLQATMDTGPEASGAGGGVESSKWRPPERRFEDRDELGRGGMGVVRRVFDTVLQRTVAMKVCKPSVAARVEGRFVEEAQITGQLDHPNIVPVYDLGVDDDRQIFFTMKLVSGRTLGKIILELRREGLGSEDLESVIQVLLRVCDAVSFAHSRGVIHRDLKPANIMVGNFGQVYLMDWGVALLRAGGRASEGSRVGSGSDPRIRPAPGAGPAAAGGLAGTVNYMAPEQAWGRLEEIDERTDVYGLGAILYEVLTGWPPHVATDLVRSLELAREGEVVPPEEVVGGGKLPPGLCEIAMKALATRPVDRHPTVEALKRDLEGFLRGGGWFGTRSFSPGDVIIREGDDADAGYVITEGHCEVFRDGPEGRRVLRRMGPGEVFGETAIFSSSPRTASVAALDRVTVKVITEESLQRELDLSSWMGAFVRSLAARFLELDARRSETDPGSQGEESGGGAGGDQG